MIVDILNHKSKYFHINNKLEKAFKFLEENDLDTLAPGKYNIDGEEVYAQVQSYVTRPSEENKWENHNKYIDIQYIVKGNEIIGWTPVEPLKVLEPYQKEKDITFYEETDKNIDIRMEAGYFAVFFAEDAHKPCCFYGSPSEVKKIVIKVKL